MANPSGSLVDRVVETNLLIIGSEGAGARAAIEAADRGVTVLVATKGYAGKSGATLTAGADIDVDSRSLVELFDLPGDVRDTPETFMEDMLVEGEYINDQRLVAIHAEEASARVKDLVDWGLKVDEMHHAPGHRYPRGLWVEGTEFPRVLVAQMKKRKIDFLEHFMMTDLVVSDGQAAGVVGVCLATGEVLFIRANAVILCTGGAMRVYSLITAPDEITGDGMAAAYRAGAELQDMEFAMFLPYCMIHPAAVTGNYFPYMMSYMLDSHALNRQGQRYMAKWDPERMEESTRDINCIAAAAEVAEGRGSPHGGTYLSFKHLPDNLIDFSAKWFPPCNADWKEGGFDMRDYMPDPTKEAIETGPCAHFWNGGIRINECCETNIPGLYAAGEGTASIHGANRISGNALTMTQVWGPRAGRFASEYVRENKAPEPGKEEIERLAEKMLGPLERSAGPTPVELRKKIQQQADGNVWVVRKGELLEKALEHIGPMRSEDIPNQATRTKERIYNRDWMMALENENMVDILEMLARASLMRTESRGSLYRYDFPQKDNVDWLKNIRLQNVDGEMTATLFDVDPVHRTPEKEVVAYGRKR
ncbi:MAG TPA: FAD-binding protein [Rhodospirillales bacterium]|jgi:succinate dehydrogenase/fumarate reductase flavoprotein subunit|nr:FAD-binding protein [Rhodospirillales bacterium]